MEHRVRQGDSIGSIAVRYGMDWRTIWNHPGNAVLRSERRSPNILFPGDVVEVPESEAKRESGATGERHRFCLKGSPARLRVRFLENGRPRAFEPYHISVDGDISEGQTDGDGWINHAIPPDAKNAKLSFLDGDEHEFALGHLDPVPEVSGIQGRLRGLGFYDGQVDGVLGPKTRSALRGFQGANNLPESGKPDHATQGALVSSFGS